MVDLSALIALLTALASAIPSASPGSLPSQAAEPPGQHCAAVIATGPDAPSITTGPSRQAGSTEPGQNTASPRPTRHQGRSTTTGDNDNAAAASSQQHTAPDDVSPSSTASHQLATRTANSSSRAPATATSGTTTPAPTTLATTATPRPSTSPEATSESVHPCVDRSSDPEPHATTEVPATEAPEGPVTDVPITDADVPADVLDLKDWSLTLPTGPGGDPDIVPPGQLAAGFENEYFQLNDAHDGVVFTAPVDGATTRNSSYPRSELREMNGTEEAAWSNTSGTHMLRVTAAVTALPESKPELVTAQIHGGDDDILQIRHEGNQLMVQYADGTKTVTLDRNYKLGTAYDIEIAAAENTVRVRYNGQPKVDLQLSGNAWYFKAGAYVQSNISKGDAANATGQVIIYSLNVEHA